MTRLAVLGNPYSGGNRRGMDAVAEVAAAHGIAHATTNSIDELDATLRDFAEQEVEVLAINGGDGTLDAAITAMRNRRPFAREPVIALLRGGTTNMVHDDVGLRGAPAAALQRVIDACHESRIERHVRERPVIAFRHGPDTEPAFGFFFGTAAVPRAIRATRQRLHPRGLAGPVGDSLSLVWTMLRLIAGRIEADPVLRPIRVAWSLDDGARAEAEMVVLVATTLNRLLLGLRPVRPDDDGFGVAALTWPYRRLWRRLPAFLRGVGPDAVDGLWRARARRLELACGAGYTMDGEMFAADDDAPVILEAAPPVRFLVV